MPLLGDDAGDDVPREVGMEMLVEIADEEERRQREQPQEYPGNQVCWVHRCNLGDVTFTVNNHCLSSIAKIVAVFLSSTTDPFI